jgi:predicted TIM-barrel fold metal-dependent hydrolase
MGAAARENAQRIYQGRPVYVSLESEERALPYVSELFGEDHIFFASDYSMNGNGRSIWPASGVSRRARTLPYRQSARVLPTNAWNFYRFGI